jgi:threonine dehydrogenase-like Zn-dependent dehydrogenase
MRALVKTAMGSGHLELREVEKPRCGDDEVLVQVKSAAICGSDISKYTGRCMIYKPPVTLGHEISGVIDELGKNVNGFDVGARVAVEANVYACGRCSYCRTGNENLCASRVGIGYDVDGGFAQFVKVPADMLISVPDNISFEVASLADIYVAVHAVVDCSDVRSGDAVVIFGPGFLGLSILQMCKLQGADPVVVVGLKRDAARLEMARELGATATLFAEEADVLKEIQQLTRGEGASTTFEVSGSPEALLTAIEVVRRGGAVTMLGLQPKSKGIPMLDVILRQISLNGVRAYTWSNCELGMRYLSEGKLKLQQFITHEFPLENWKEAFDMLVEGKGTKIVLKP